MTNYKFRFRVVVKKADDRHEAICVDANTGESAALQVEEASGGIAVSVSKIFNYETVNGETGIAEWQCNAAVERAFNNIILEV